MAAGFEIAPNPVVLAVQAAIFAANIIVVKKLFVTPYLKVRDERDRLTIGGKDAATQAIAAAEQLTVAIDQRIVSGAELSRREREAMRQTAMTRRQELLAAAEADARRTVEEMEKQIKQDVVAEKQKIPGIVADLSSQVFQATVN